MLDSIHRLQGKSPYTEWYGRISELSHRGWILNSNLAVQPNHEKIFSSIFEYNLLNKHVDHLDQQMGAGHSLLGNKDVKIMKNCTIILIGCMILALKVLAMFTLSIGAQILKGFWIDSHMRAVRSLFI